MQVTVVVGADGEVEDVDAAASVSLAGWLDGQPGRRSFPDLRPLGLQRYVAHPPVWLCVLPHLKKPKQTNKSPFHHRQPHTLHTIRATIMIPPLLLTRI